MYWDAFKAMQLAGEQLQSYHGTLVGFAGEQADVMGHITLLTTFGDKENAKTIKVRYLVVRTLCASYNIIIGMPAFNALGAVMSTLYLVIKYPLENGHIPKGQTRCSTQKKARRRKKTGGRRRSRQA
jgi:hypothetical protein